MPEIVTAAMAHLANMKFVILGRATERVQIASNEITAMPVNPAAKAPMRLMFDIRLTHTKRAVRYVADASIE